MAYKVKMTMELPEIRRSCFIFPLRYGIIIWGYAKLISTAVDLYMKVMLLINIDPEKNNVAWQGLVLANLVQDFVLCFILIVAAHMKNIKLFRVFYIYGCILLVFQVLAVVVLTIFMFYVTFKDQPLTKGKLSHKSMAWHYLMYASTFYASLILDIYILLLVKTEIMKLKEKNQYTLEDDDEAPKSTVTYTKKEGEKVIIADIKEMGKL